MAFEIGSRQDDIMALRRFGHGELKLEVDTVINVSHEKATMYMKIGIVI